jgi:hypothetical protein
MALVKKILLALMPVGFMILVRPHRIYAGAWVRPRYGCTKQQGLVSRSVTRLF